MASGPWIAVVAMTLWARSPDPTWLLMAAAGVWVGLWKIGERGHRWGGGMSALVFVILGAYLATHASARLEAEWEEHWEAREAEVGERIAELLDQRLVAAEQASDQLAEIALADPGALNVEDLRRMRLLTGVDALALYRPSGDLAIWDGVHWGRVPDGVRGGFLRHTYLDRPLFGYLYVTALTDDGYVAMAADLLRADLPDVLDVGQDDFESVFERTVGERITVTQHDPLTGRPTWDLSLPDRRLASVVVDRPTAAERAGERLDRWRGWIAAIVLVAWFLLVMGRPPGRFQSLSAAATLVVLVGCLPLDALGAPQGLFGRNAAGPPGVPSWFPGRAALVLLAAVTAGAVLPRPRIGVHPLLAGVVGGSAFWVLMSLTWALHGDQSVPYTRLEWIALQVALTTALVLSTLGISAVARAAPESRWCRWAALSTALLLGVSAVAWIWLSGAIPGWWWLLWAVPFGCLAAAHGGGGDGVHSPVRLLFVVWVAGSAAVPGAWGLHVETRMAAAEARLADLGPGADPDLERALGRMAVVADSLDRADREEIDVLYRAWLESGLAGSGQPIRLTRWLPDGFRGIELRVGTESLLPGVLPTLLQEQRASDASRLLLLNRDDARYVLTVPLRDGGVLSAVAPPFATGYRPSALDAFVRGPDPRSDASMSFIALLPGDPRGDQPVRWVRSGASWRAETGVRFANDRAYRVHHALALPGPLLGIARGGLVLLLDASLVVLFGWFGANLAGSRFPRGMPRAGLARSFQARLTLALLGFFALATALIGGVAYRGLSGASYRSAELIAERVVDDAAVWYRMLAGGMERLARQVGADLVVYDDSGLVEGSVEELVELGLYPGWTPFPVHTAIEQLETSNRFADFRLGGWEYVTAFRRMPGGEILASQVPLQAGTQAVRASDLLELLAFFVALGAGLSLLLAMSVSRALTRPLQALYVASERVGSGRTAVRLPEERVDEFGAVFRAFNRMVERIRTSRRQLVRTSRRTQLIMEESAVGMLAVDAEGRITLLNPRAAELLGGRVAVGSPVTGVEGLAGALGPWLERYLAQEIERADSDVQVGDRRVRVRARRLGGRGSGGGAVVAMDDVTDELRVERVLAWGEMARQVAHEVKNPLTPIKLSIQHVRRAWQDGRDDFEDILLRNATAMLREIDRLADIAQGFARFGAPGEAAGPLVAVEPGLVIDEVLALYGSSVSAVRFERGPTTDMPPVVARVAEMKEVLVNLLENARLASGPDSTVRVSLERGGDGVVMVVADEGRGIEPEILPRIFEPQFSTRSSGSGLGLAIVQRLVRSWGASIEVTSRPGAGTTATIRLRTWHEDGAGDEVSPQDVPGSDAAPGSS